MKIINTILILSLFCCNLTIAYNISDVSIRDAAYTSIKKSVDKGYLSLFNNQSFRGQEKLTRKETALMLDKLLSKIDAEQLQLSEAEIKELLHLSHTFKDYLALHDTKMETYKNQLLEMEKQNTAANHTISKLNDELATTSATLKETKQNQFYLIIGTVIAGLLGILVK